MDKKIRRYLSSMAVNVKSTITIGKDGLTDAILANIENELFSHELIKINVLGNAEGFNDDDLIKITQATGCEIVRKIGRKIIAYKHSDKQNVYHYINEKGEPNN